jgi:hypothetical protein
MFFALSTTLVVGSNSELTLFPGQGSVEQGNDFTVDVLIDTKGSEVLLVRAVLNFDPELVRLDEVEINETLFCDWPTGEQLVDNDDGIFMATGFCQSGGENELYSTVGEPDVFARLKFATLQAGSLVLEWEFSGIDEPMTSVVISDGSPPQNILDFENITYNYTITEPVKMPETSIPALENISSTFLLGGSVFVLAFLANVLLDPKRRYFKKSRTIVVYDDGEK